MEGRYNGGLPIGVPPSTYYRRHLNETEVNEIRRLYHECHERDFDIAHFFGVPISKIQLVIDCKGIYAGIGDTPLAKKRKERKADEERLRALAAHEAEIDVAFEYMLEHIEEFEQSADEQPDDEEENGNAT